MNHFNTIRSCIRNSNDAQLKKELEHMKFGEILSILNKLQEQDQAKVFDALNEYTAIKAFKVLSFKTRQNLIRGMHHEKAARLLNAIPDDDRTAFLEELPSRTVNELHFTERHGPDDDGGCLGTGITAAGNDQGNKE